MKYKVGDKVRIKTWEEMHKEYGQSERTSSNWGVYVNTTRRFYKNIDEDISSLKTNRFLTIKSTCSYSRKGEKKYEYRVKEFPFFINEEWIVEELLDPINSRFEILDL